MKVLFAIFSFITLCVLRSTVYLYIKQNIGHAWCLEPHNLDKLIF